MLCIQEKKLYYACTGHAWSTECPLSCELHAISQIAIVKSGSTDKDFFTFMLLLRLFGNFLVSLSFLLIVLPVYKFIVSSSSLVSKSAASLADQDIVARSAKFFTMYKRSAHRVIINRKGDLLVRPRPIEASLRLQPVLRQCSAASFDFLCTKRSLYLDLPVPTNRWPKSWYGVSAQAHQRQCYLRCKAQFAILRSLQSWVSSYALKNMQSQSVWHAGLRLHSLEVCKDNLTVSSAPWNWQILDMRKSWDQWCLKSRCLDLVRHVTEDLCLLTKAIRWFRVKAHTIDFFARKKLTKHSHYMHVDNIENCCITSMLLILQGHPRL